jgi:hypothetical protein
MLDKITIPSLGAYYTSLHAQDENTPICEVLKSFFALALENNYTYEITKQEALSDKEGQKVEIKVMKPGIGFASPIGTVTLEFSKNTVLMVASSNWVVSTIMANSNSLKVSRQIAADDAFLRLGYSVECFGEARKFPEKKALKSETALLAMNFFGVITETASQHELVDLIYYVLLLVEPQKESWRWVEDNPEWKNRSRIINLLTKYILTGNISRQDVSNMCDAASMLEGANANTFRKLSVAGIVISPLVIAGAVAGVFALNTIFPPFGIIAAIIIFLSVVTFALGASYLARYSSSQKPDFPSNAVLFLADKIEETLPQEDHPLPTIEVSNNPSITPDQTASSLPQSCQSPLRTEVKAKPNFAQLLEALYEETLKPALKKLYGENINQQVYQSLKTGLALRYNQGQSIAWLKEGIESAAKIYDKNDRLTELCRVCDVEKPKTLQPF